MRKEFEVHRLNDDGMMKARTLAAQFSNLLTACEDICDLKSDSRGEGAREMAIVRTKLEEAAFFCKKAMAVQAKNQEAKTS